MLFVLLLIVLVAVAVNTSLRRDFKKGLMVATFILIISPTFWIYKIPGPFPNISLYRAIMIVLILAWISKGGHVNVRSSPLYKLIVLYALIMLVTTIFSTLHGVSFKYYASHVLETIIYYFIVVSTDYDESEILEYLRYIVYGAFVVAIVAVFEKYTHFNPVDTFLPNYTRNPVYSNDIMSTFPHRILLGAAMAMTWPLAISLSRMKNDFKGKKYNILSISVLVIIATIYFATSRGPWLAATLAGLIYFSFGSNRVKKYLIYLSLIVLSVLLFRPGVYDTILGLGERTFQADTLKGSSYSYRWELWKKANMEISKSSKTYFIGYGPGTSEFMEMGGYASYDGKYHKFWSWDNQYAANLLETGILGLAAAVIVYMAIIMKCTFPVRKYRDKYGDIKAALLAGILVYTFMMSNVLIFAPQLNYIFWGFFAASMKMDYN